MLLLAKFRNEKMNCLRLFVVVYNDVVVMEMMSTTELSRERRSKVIEELLEFDRSLLMTVDTVFKNKLPSAYGEHTSTPTNLPSEENFSFA